MPGADVKAMIVATTAGRTAAKAFLSFSCSIVSVKLNNVMDVRERVVSLLIYKH